MEGGEIDERVVELFDKRRMVVVSNRVPYNIVRTPAGTQYRRGIGGLVTALHPILKTSNGLWVGWNGVSGPIREALPSRLKVGEPEGYQYFLRFVPLNEVEVSRYYHGFSNRTLWPNFHNFIGKCHFDRAQWNSYVSVNEKFSKIIYEETSGKDDLIWVHDYHLTLVPAFLRQVNPSLKIFFFLHTPFPHCNTFRVIPWCKQILEGMLGSDKIGFHVEDYVRNFLSCVEELLGLPVDHDRGIVKFKNMKVQVKAHPISIDYDEFFNLARSEVVQKHLQRLKRGVGDKLVILGVDRLDYTKGIKERLLAVERLLEKYKDTRNKILFIQIAVPSRTRVGEYRAMKREIDETIGRINGRFTVENWTPISYIYRSIPREDLVALYRLADVALITPVRDGMNLVAKEYITSQVEKNGVLILSQFTGAKAELKDALHVNPYDIDAVADSLYRALTMSPEEKKERCARMQEVVKKNDIYKWVSDYFKDSVLVS